MRSRIVSGAIALVACQSISKPRPEVLGVVPAVVPSAAATAALVTGDGFLGEATNRVDSSGRPTLDLGFSVELSGPEMRTLDATFVDTRTLEVTIPAGLAEGVYHVAVVTPGGARDTLENGLSVVGEPETVTVEDAPDGTGSEVRVVLDRSTDDAVELWAIARDSLGSFAGTMEVTWTLIGDIGRLDTGPAPSTVLELTRPGDGSVVAQVNGFAPASAGPFVVGVGAPAAARIESASGTEIGSLTLGIGSDLTVYAEGYDADGNRTGPLAVDWSVTGGIGTMSPESSASTSQFEATAQGNGQLVATPAAGESDATGNLTIIAGAAAGISIEDRADGTGSEVGTLALTADDAVSFFAVSRDAAGNFVGTEEVAWGWAATCDLGGLSAVEGTSVTFEAATTGTCRLEADHATLGDDATGDITVSPGALDRLAIVDADRVVVGDVDMTAGGPDCTALACSAGCGSCGLTAEGRDADGNPTGTEVADWSLTTRIGALDPPNGASTVLTATTVGSTRVAADVPGFGGNTDALTGVVTVAAGVLAAVEIRGSSGQAITTLTLLQGGSESLTAAGLDGFGNDVPLTCANVTWTATIGSVTPSSGCAVVLDAGASPGTGSVEVDSTDVGGAGADDSVSVTVTAGTIDAVYVTLDPGAAPCANDPGGTYTTDEDSLTFFATGCSGSSYLGLVPVTWGVTHGIGDVAPTSASSTVLTLHTPGTGRVTATDGTFFAETGDLLVGVGVVDRVAVEDAPGSAAEIGPLVIEAGGPDVVLWAAAYDADNNFIANDPVDWVVAPALGDLSTDRGATTTFTPHTTGVGTITADHPDITGDGVVAVEVTPGPLVALVIESAGDPSGGSPIGDVSLRTDQRLSLFANGRDAFGNYISWQTATWSQSPVHGLISAGELPGEVVFEPSTTGTLTITAASLDATLSDSTGTIEVRHGPAVRLAIAFNQTDPIQEIGDVTLDLGDSLEMFAVSLDAEGNRVADEVVTWSVDNGDWTLDPGPSSAATLAPSVAGTGVVTVGGHATLADDTTGVIEVVEAPCGDGKIDPGEDCDSDELGGASCWSLARLRAGGPGLACADCQFDTSGCSDDRIDRWEDVLTAVTEVYGIVASGDRVHHTISIKGGTLGADQPLVLDECAGPCALAPVGLTLQPLGDDLVEIVSATGFADDALISIVTGNNVIRGLSFLVTERCLRVGPGPSADTNWITHNRFEIMTAGDYEVIEVWSHRNRIEANAFHNEDDAVPAAVAVEGAAGSEIGMNIIDGPFTAGLRLRNVPAAPRTQVDHNSVRSRLGSAQTVVALTGVALEEVAGLCYRNNILFGEVDGAGIALAGDVSLAPASDCGQASGTNVNLHETACVGGVGSGMGCALLCTDGPMCDRFDDPGFEDNWLCLTPATNPLVDDGLHTGEWDMWDDPGDNNLYSGAGPEVGAREHGVRRIFGGTESQCD